MNDPMMFMDYGRFFSVSGKEITIKFDQELINWINKEFPDYNWYAAHGPTFKTVSLFDTDGFGRTVRSFDMNDFAFPVGIMFEHDMAKIETLIRKIAEYLTQDIPKSTDIYLLNLKGHMTPIDDDGFIKEVTNINGNPLVKVGVRSVIRMYVDDGSQIEDEDEES